MNRMSVKDRFYYIAKIPKDKTQCWIWQNSIDGSGYGCISVNNKKTKAHRLSYILHKGEIPKGLCVCHTCDNRRCVNPDHLWLGTWAENLEDMRNKGRGYFLIVPSGSENGRAKLKDNDIRQIRKYAKEGFTSLEISKLYPVNRNMIDHIIKRRNWKHVT